MCACSFVCVGVCMVGIGVGAWCVCDTAHLLVCCVHSMCRCVWVWPVCVCICVHNYAYLCLCISTCVCVCIVYVCVCVCVSMCLCKRVCVYVCVEVHASLCQWSSQCVYNPVAIPADRPDKCCYNHNLVLAHKKVVEGSTAPVYDLDGPWCDVWSLGVIILRFCLGSLSVDDITEVLCTQDT